MSRKLIIPIFVPHEGCPVQCSFCDQRELTGVKGHLPSIDIQQAIATYLKPGQSHRHQTVELAFYGGSFTMLPLSRQESLLVEADKVRRQGLIDGIRLSTRPDGIDSERLDLLERYGVSTVELGVQSMDDAVLARNNRGHTAQATRDALILLKSRGFRTGAQLMPGLPGDTADTFLESVRKVISLVPDMARIYPAVVLRNTEMETWYRAGSYQPLPLSDAVDLCAEALLMFRKAGIPVIRLGLQSTPDLKQSFVAGPYHPAFRQLVESAIARRMLAVAHTVSPDTGMPFLVHPRYLSTAQGQKKDNLFTFKMRYNYAPKLAVDCNVPYEAVRRGDLLVTPENIQPSAFSLSI
ncbi:MAG: radical SAM protein [Nitrospirota bacterium]|nr:radical SAM protein [Nitrospirota bacterium]